MDEERFDSLARQLAALTSRRTVLKLLAASLVAGIGGARLPRTSPLAAQRIERCDVAQCRDYAGISFTSCMENCAELDSDVQWGKASCQGVCWVARSHSLTHCAEGGGCLVGRCVGGICCTGSNDVNCGDDKCTDGACPGNQVFNCARRRCECPPDTYLCPSGGGQICMSVPCPTGKKANPTTCICECSNTCPPDQVLNPDDCTCGCPGISCPAGQSPDPKTCKCTCDNRCPAGQAQDPVTCACRCGASSCAGLCCNGRCIDANATCPEDDDDICITSGGCDSNIECNPGIPGCSCATTTEGSGSCIQSGLCEDKQLCLTSTDCPPSFACIPDNCCPDGIPRCGPICQSAANTDVADQDQLWVASGSARFLQRAEPARSVQASFYG
jgi:hypothetical protein